MKKDAPVMVVLGNPPYSGHSANTGDWIKALLKGTDIQADAKTGNYFEVDGEPLGERNPKWLNDDYVKFIRFAQWRIEQTGYGVLGFISNHGYLDNPTFRGMRQSLMDTFDDIYILDLHGNSKKKETAPDGGSDKNVFDIQQGVAIGIFVKRSNGGKKPATVRHAELFGLREGKYKWLWESGIANTKWANLKPESPYYLFVPQDVKLFGEYEQGWKVTDAMPINSVGIVTSRDHFVIDFEESALKERISDFLDLRNSDDEVRSKYFGTNDNKRYLPGDNSGWKMAEKRRALITEKDWRSYITKCLYRPFDERAIFNHQDAIERGRPEVMRHMLAGGNLGLIFMRQVALNDDYNHFCVTRTLIDNRAFYSNKGIMSLSPLYLYPSLEKKDLFDTEPELGRKPNFVPEFISDFAEKLGMKFIPDGKGDRKKTFGPEDVFHYMYAVFHSPTYRSRYAEFLKMDFPRLPLTTNAELFRKLCALGEELTGLHLMEKSGPATATFPIAGDNTVENVGYTEPKGEDKGRVFINKTQYFDGVPLEVWAFHVGGYQVCQKWLKDRKGRPLSYDELTHYMNVVSALGETIRIMAEIDEAIDANGGWPVK